MRGVDSANRARGEEGLSRRGFGRAASEGPGNLSAKEGEEIPLRVIIALPKKLGPEMTFEVWVETVGQDGLQKMTAKTPVAAECLRTQCARGRVLRSEQRVAPKASIRRRPGAATGCVTIGSFLLPNW